MINEEIDYRTTAPLGARAIDLPPSRPRLNWRRVITLVLTVIVTIAIVGGYAWLTRQ